MAGARSWMCVCGHRLLDHILARDPTPSAPSVYHWYGCTVKGCFCKSARNETGTIDGGPA